MLGCLPAREGLPQFRRRGRLKVLNCGSILHFFVCVKQFIIFITCIRGTESYTFNASEFRRLKLSTPDTASPSQSREKKDLLRCNNFLISRIERLANRFTFNLIGLYSVDEAPGNSESSQLTTGFNAAHTTHTMKPGRTLYHAKSRQDKFHLYLHSQGRSLGCNHEHPAVTNVDAVSSVIVVRAVVPAKQKWQRYLKPPRIPAFDRLIHIRTHISFFTDSLTVSTTPKPHKQATVLGKTESHASFAG
jgi:hypothetical protein